MTRRFVIWKADLSAKFFADPKMPLFSHPVRLDFFPTLLLHSDCGFTLHPISFLARLPRAIAEHTKTCPPCRWQYNGFRYLQDLREPRTLRASARDLQRFPLLTGRSPSRSVYCPWRSHSTQKSSPMTEAAVVAAIPPTWLSLQRSQARIRRAPRSLLRRGVVRFSLCSPESY